MRRVKILQLNEISCDHFRPSITTSKDLLLFANVLPILTGFWLALYYTQSSIVEYWDVFLLTMAGGTLVMAGALTLNNWYEVDLDE